VSDPTLREIKEQLDRIEKRGRELPEWNAVFVMYIFILVLIVLSSFFVISHLQQ
jgi:predicted PurR-regulated permease PerM